MIEDLNDFWRTSRKSILAAVTAALSGALSTWSATGVLDWKAGVAAIVSAVVAQVVVYWVRNDPPGEADAFPRETLP